MIELKIKDRTINLPTRLNELNEEVFDRLTSHIHLQDKYCIIALAYKIRMPRLGMIDSKQFGNDVFTIPLIAKVNNNELNFKAGDKAIINPSSIELGTHVNINTVVSLSNMFSLLSEEQEVKKDIAVNKDNKYNTDVYLLGFKIVPVSDIRGTISNGALVDDMFEC